MLRLSTTVLEYLTDEYEEDFSLCPIPFGDDIEKRLLKHIERLRNLRSKKIKCRSKRRQ